MNGILSAFDKPAIHQPPEIHQPFRLLVIRVLRRVIGLLPDGWVAEGTTFGSFSTRLMMGDLRRTNGLAYRVVRARRLGMKVGDGCRLYSLHVASEAELIELGNGVIVSGEVMFITHDGSVFTALEKFPAINGHYGRIKIGNNCFIGARATIMPGVELGDRCVVAAGAVVMDSFPANSVIAGNPATLVCPTSMYMELKKHSAATIYDAAYAFPLKMPPEILAAQMADVPYKKPRRRVAAGGSPRPIDDRAGDKPRLERMVP